MGGILFTPGTGRADASEIYSAHVGLHHPRWQGQLVEVALEGGKYRLPYRDECGGELVRITSHPLDGGKLLVWRLETPFYEKAIRKNIEIYEATKLFGYIFEKSAVARLHCYISHNTPNLAEVKHLIVDPPFRRRGIGTTLVKTLNSELKRLGDVEFVLFPKAHKEEGYYRSLNIDKTTSDRNFSWAGYRGEVQKIARQAEGWWTARFKHGSVRGQNQLLVRWQRANPRFIK